METQLPLWYHPTNVFLLDDDRHYLNFLTRNIDPLFPFVMDTDPQKALRYLQSHTYRPQEMAKHLVQQNFDNAQSVTQPGIETYDINISRLRGDLSSPERFKKITVAIVDRYIPGSDGIEFCHQLKKEFNFPIKLILLTGATEVGEAISAFNAGKIDAFIEKKAGTAKEMVQEINRTLRNLSWQQFQTISQELLGILTNSFSHIFDSKFYECFESIRVEEQTVEFHLLDSSGSFLLLNKEGHEKIFLVRKNEDFDMMYELAKDAGAFQNVLQNLRNRQQFPFTRLGSAHLSAKGDTWDQLMVPMHKIPGRELFYSVIDYPGEEAMGFNQYRNEIWPTP